MHELRAQAGEGPSPEPRQQGEENAEHHTLVTVPVGAQPGEEISALLPDGREIELHVPEGAQPGDEIEVHVPSDEEEEGHAQQQDEVEEDQGRVIAATRCTGCASPRGTRTRTRWPWTGAGPTTGLGSNASPTSDEGRPTLVRALR